MCVVLLTFLRLWVFVNVCGLVEISKAVGVCECVWSC